MGILQLLGACSMKGKFVIFKFLGCYNCKYAPF